MTDISVVGTSYQVEKRDWLVSQHGTDPGMTPSCTLDISKFTAGTHFPNGYIPSGTALASVAGGMVGPSAGTGATAVGILFSAVTVLNTANGQTLAKVGGAMLIHGRISKSKLPFQSGTGSLTATDLPLIIQSA